MSIYHIPRGNTRSEKIVRLLRKMPYCGYQKIARLCQTNRQTVAVVARLYDLQRGNNRIDLTDKKRMVEMIRKTALTYAEIGRQCGGYGRRTVSHVAHVEGIARPRQWAIENACKVARKGRKP